jgi:hypothetical protein
VFALTGTGFATTVPFGAFTGTLEIDTSSDTFVINASFTLGSASNGINPPAEPVTLTVGSFTGTIPAGLLRPGAVPGSFTFNGVINGVGMGVTITSTGANQYSFSAEVVTIPATVNPVPVTLTIGDDSGTTSIIANIHGT